MFWFKSLLEAKGVNHMKHQCSTSRKNDKRLLIKEIAKKKKIRQIVQPAATYYYLFCQKVNQQQCCKSYFYLVPLSELLTIENPPHNTNRIAVIANIPLHTTWRHNCFHVRVSCFMTVSSPHILFFYAIFNF